MSSVNSCIIYYKYTLNDTNYYKNTILLKVSSNPKKPWVIYKKCFRNIYAPLGAKFKITTDMYKALWFQNFVQGRTKHNQIRVKDYIIMIKWQKARISESLDDLEHWAQKVVEPWHLNMWTENQ